MPLLEGEGVTKYFGGLTAVSDVDFHVDQGEIVGLIGPNGAGKTTLFNLISGAFAPESGVIRFKGENITGLITRLMMPHHMSRMGVARKLMLKSVKFYANMPVNEDILGVIRFKGEKITGSKPHQICRGGVARTFQSVKVFGNMPVLENVLLGSFFGTPTGMSPADATKEATELLDFVGLSAVKATLAKDLTLVNQKRLEVARALATKPELLLLDELMAGLNPTETAEGMELVTRIRDKGITIVMIEHVMRAIMGVCDRIMVLHHGEKIAEGTPEEISTSKKVIEVYLGE